MPSRNKLNALLFCHWAHTSAGVAVAPTLFVADTIEEEAVRAVGTIRRRTQVVAVRALAVRSITVVIASSGKEDAVAILFALYLVTIDAIARCPCPGTII